jgi:hypothetical protein
MLKRKLIAISLIILIASISIGLVIFYDGISTPTKTTKLKCAYGDWDRISYWLPHVVEADGGKSEVIKLSGEEFVDRINHKIDTHDTYEGYIQVFKDCGRLGIGEPNPYPNGRIFESIYYTGEDYSNVMWFYEEVKSEPILQENGSYYVHTESLTIYYAYGVLPK